MAQVDALADDVLDTCARLGIGRTTFYSEINCGRLRAVKVGRKTLVSRQAQQDWLDSLPLAATA